MICSKDVRHLEANRLNIEGIHLDRKYRWDEALPGFDGASVTTQETSIWKMRCENMLLFLVHQQRISNMIKNDKHVGFAKRK